MSKINNARQVPSVNPTRKMNKFEHRPIRWIVKQIFTHDDGYQEAIYTGYHNKLDAILPTPSLQQAISNLQKYGGELWADYEDQVQGPIFVQSY
jgi:hypothetical protein